MWKDRRGGLLSHLQLGTGSSSGGKEEGQGVELVFGHPGTSFHIKH